MKKMIFILDALKSGEVRNYIRNYFCRTCHLIDVLPPFSFEPDAAYLTGHTPEETDSGTHYWYEAEKSLFKNKDLLLKLLPDKPRILKKISKKIILKLILKNQQSLGMIPFNMLKYFSSPNSKDIFDGSCPYKFKTIFNRLEDNNIKYGYAGVPLYDGSLGNIKKQVSVDFLLKNEVNFIYLGDLDGVGHKYGGNSKEYEKKLIDIIEYIKQIEKFYKSKNEEYKILVFGDHGMVNIDRTINIEKILNKLPLKVGKDYIYFLDSTLARFWFMNDKARELIVNSIPNNKYGTWINEKDVKHYKINYRHNKFGDAIWWASGGTLILPNFWQGNKKVKGMHGYRDEVVDNNTIIFGDIHDEINEEKITMMTVNKILKKFLEVE